MAHDAALALANELWALSGHLCGDVLRALQDDNISVFEGLELGLHGVSLGSQIARLIAEGGPALHSDLAYVFEHATLTLPGGPPQA